MTPEPLETALDCDVAVVGGGIAGLSASLYLSRAMHRTLVLDAGHSMVVWEPDIENYLGFPGGISGKRLLREGRRQAQHFGARFVEARIDRLERERGSFVLTGTGGRWRSRRVLLCTGLFHLPPELEGVRECLGQSLFFCKDCDGHRVRGRRVVVYGRTNEAAEYALAMLAFSPQVVLVTDGQVPRWDGDRAGWLSSFGIRVVTERLVELERTRGKIRALKMEGGGELLCEALFTTRGDVYFNHLARMAGAQLDDSGQVCIDADCRTIVEGLYAAGCLTPANCQIAVAVGQGATAAQAINRNLFEEELASGRLRRFSPNRRYSPRQRPASKSR